MIDNDAVDADDNDDSKPDDGNVNDNVMIETKGTDYDIKFT